MADLRINIRGNAASATAALNQTTRGVQAVGRAAATANTRTNVFRQSITNLSTASRNLSGNLQGIAAIVVTGGFSRVLDQYQNLENRIRVVTNTSQDFAAAQQNINNIATQTRQNLFATGQFYTRLALATQELGVSQERLERITLSVNKAVAASGASAQEAAGGLIQLAQGIASNRLGGEELRSVLENLPAVAQSIARGLGTTTGQLRELSRQGRLTTETVLGALEADVENVDALFSRTNVTVGQSINLLTNELARGLGEGGALGQALTYSIQGITALINAVNELLNTGGDVENSTLVQALQTIGNYGFNIAGGEGDFFGTPGAAGANRAGRRGGETFGPPDPAAESLDSFRNRLQEAGVDLDSPTGRRAVGARSLFLRLRQNELIENRELFADAFGPNEDDQRRLLLLSGLFGLAGAGSGTGVGAGAGAIRGRAATGRPLGGRDRTVEGRTFSDREIAFEDQSFDSFENRIRSEILRGERFSEFRQETNIALARINEIQQAARARGRNPELTIEQRAQAGRLTPDEIAELRRLNREIAQLRTNAEAEATRIANRARSFDFIQEGASFGGPAGAAGAIAFGSAFTQEGFNPGLSQVQALSGEFSPETLPIGSQLAVTADPQRRLFAEQRPDQAGRDFLSFLVRPGQLNEQAIRERNAAAGLSGTAFRQSIDATSEALRVAREARAAEEAEDREDRQRRFNELLEEINDEENARTDSYERLRQQANDSYDRDVEDFRNSLEAKEIDQEQFDALEARRAQIRNAQINEINRLADDERRQLADEAYQEDLAIINGLQQARVRYFQEQLEQDEELAESARELREERERLAAIGQRELFGVRQGAIDRRRRGAGDDVLEQQRAEREQAQLDFERENARIDNLEGQGVEGAIIDALRTGNQEELRSRLQESLQIIQDEVGTASTNLNDLLAQVFEIDPSTTNPFVTGVEAMRGTLRGLSEDAARGELSLSDFAGEVLRSIQVRITAAAIEFAAVYALAAAASVFGGPETGALVLRAYYGQQLGGSLSDLLPGAGSGEQGVPIGELHNGGVVPYRSGLSGDEVPFILRSGERVLNRAEAQNYPNGGGMPIQVNVINNSSAQVTPQVRARQAQNGRQQVVEIVMEDINANGPIAKTITRNFSGTSRRIS